MKTTRCRRIALAALAVALGAARSPIARAEDRTLGSSASGNTAADRVRKARDGPAYADPSERFRNPDPEARMQVLKSVADEGDPRGKNVALEALDDVDVRVQSKALDCLVRLRATDAAPALVQRMFLKGSSAPLRRRILLTLGVLGDAETGRQLLEYARSESDSGLRGAAIYAVGKLADPTLAGALTTFADAEQEPGIARVARDAAARISAPAP